MNVDGFDYFLSKKQKVIGLVVEDEKDFVVLLRGEKSCEEQ